LGAFLGAIQKRPSKKMAELSGFQSNLRFPLPLHSSKYQPTLKSGPDMDWASLLAQARPAPGKRGFARNALLAWMR